MNSCPRRIGVCLHFFHAEILRLVLCSVGFHEYFIEIHMKR